MLGSEHLCNLYICNVYIIYYILYIVDLTKLLKLIIMEQVSNRSANIT